MELADNRLQERLARLEAGEPLEACLAGLPEDEALPLRNAAALRTIAATAAPAGGAQLAEQRRELLQLAKRNSMKSSAVIHPLTKQQPRWFLPSALASGAFALLSCLLVFVLAAGLPGLLRPDGFQGSRIVPLSAPDPNPQSASVEALNGVVEVQTEDGAWQAVQSGQAITAGQRLRTGAASGATLAFYDGSTVQLGADSELSIDQLDAQRSGARQIVLTQHVGESQHDVVPSSDPGSRYAVNTPSGVGEAKGTSFRVFVTVALVVSFEVEEGAVAVTNSGTTVLVVAGQVTVIHTSGVPSQPVFWIKGEGIVEKTGLVWIVAGRTFRADDDTVLVGNPAVGDKVAFRGRIASDGSPILYWVVLVTLKIDFDDDDDDNLGCLRFSTAVRETQPNQVILQDWSGIGLNSGVSVQGDIKFASVIVVAGCTQLNGSFIVTHILVVYQLEALPVIIKNPGGGGGGGDDGGDDNDGGDDDDDD
jgi:ferric-dicitrate binding protein FerR (iron transport regulator)